MIIAEVFSLSRPLDMLSRHTKVIVVVVIVCSDSSSSTSKSCDGDTINDQAYLVGSVEALSAAKYAGGDL